MDTSVHDRQWIARLLVGAGIAALVCLWPLRVAGQESGDDGATLDAAVISEEDEAFDRLSLRDWVSGSLNLGIDAARSDRDNDIKLDQVLRLRIAPPKRDDIRVQVSLWTIEDLDGREDPTSVLRSINDASRAAVEARLLSLYLEVDDTWGDSTLRIGRQRILDGVVYNRMDGAYFKQRRGNWDWYAFGGARASVYEDAHEDSVAGAGASVRLPTRTRAALDFYYAEDDRSGGTTDDASVVSLTLRQQLSPYHSLFGRSTWHRGFIDEVRLAATGIFIKPEIVYNIAYRQRLSFLGDRPTDINGFTGIVGELNEFEDFHASLDFPVSERLTVTLEGQLHDAEGASVNTGNRDYNRYGAILSGDDFGKGIDFSVTFEQWDVDSAEDAVVVTGDVSKEWEKVKVTWGADYERYQDRVTTLDPLLLTVDLVETHEDVYSFFSRVHFTIDENRSVWFRLTYEDADTPDAPYWRLRGVYSIRF